MKYVFINDNQKVFSITCMCHVLNVKSSSYYNWINRGVSNQQIHRNQCELLVRAAYSETRERYGYERLHARLKEQGHHISQYMVTRSKKEYGIVCCRHKRFKVAINSNHNKFVYPNILNQQFDAKHPNLAKQCFSGSMILLISGPMRVGCIYRESKIYTPKSWSVMLSISE